VRSGIPIFLRDELLASPGDARFEKLDSDSRQKVHQRQWHDVAHMDEGDYKESSYYSKGLFACLLYYQLREAEVALRGQRYGRMANICSGHGFELEFLSLFGERIIAFDISWMSLRKTIARGLKLGVAVEGICCDVEELPVVDSAFDLVLTHHSLHHLAHPWHGLEEMARITSRHCMFFEPAKGFTRNVITGLGLKPKVEESGNLVFEFSRKELECFCSDHGLRIVNFNKCLVTGAAHEPAWFRRFDKIGISPTLGSVIKMGNKLFGNALGTKCSALIEKTVISDKPRSTAAAVEAIA